MAGTEISLDTNDDLLYVKSNILRATQEKLEIHLPVSATSTRDALRKRVEEMLDEFVNRTIEMAKPSLLINGLRPALSTPTVEEDLEPYDESLRDRLQSLSAELEAATLEITTLRRSIPLEAASIYTGLCKDIDAQSELATITDSVVDNDVKEIKIERENDVKRNFEEGIRTLRDLTKNIPLTNAKLERAKEIVEYIYS